jgi:hypothetical protein
MGCSAANGEVLASQCTHSGPMLAAWPQWRHGHCGAPDSETDRKGQAGSACGSSAAELAGGRHKSTAVARQRGASNRGKGWGKDSAWSQSKQAARRPVSTSLGEASMLTFGCSRRLNYGENGKAEERWRSRDTTQRRGSRAGTMSWSLA